MEEITLTGGTLMPSGDTPATLGSGQPTPTPHGHSHSHSHGHSHSSHCQHEQDDQHQPSIMLDQGSMEELMDAPKEEICRTFSTLLRFGRFEPVEQLWASIEEKKGLVFIGELLRELDSGGHSLLHWASKRVDDIRFLQSLVEYLQKLKALEVLNVASTDNVGMRPLHWASTEGSIPHIALLLKHGADLEAKDASGCTPLLIAAQYGQVEVVAFLLKAGANINAVDSSWDTALHWAAYKGSIQVCGLLSYYQSLEWTTQDAYGQTPLHLAALRGHTSVVRYILSHMLPRNKKDILFLKDKNERTPLDLAIHKNRPTVEACLREAMAAVQDPRGYMRKTLLSNFKDMLSAKNWRLWMGFTGGMDEMDSPQRFPYYYILLNFALHFGFMIFVFAPIASPENGLMWDKSGWLLWNFSLMFLCWYLFYKTVKTPAGYMDDSHKDIGKWRRSYEETLDSYADITNANQMDRLQPLCHTCHIARPLRSKHCRVVRKCVLVFDHYCPFVDNTIGLMNYRFFYLFLTFMTLAGCSFILTLYMYLSRYKANGNSMPWMTLLIGLEVSITTLPLGGMFAYHTQLCMVNLTTNEHLNVRKYKYLYPTSSKSGKRHYRNPWFKGWMGNFMDRMQPSDRCYLITNEQQALMIAGSPNTNSSGDGTQKSGAEMV
mmetsp:Transcript_133691/g.198727  ORF Transcript_133691/g.198727 Transcript_133691/m.198727 type:complete len:660 (+) Transcript_133691:163-2142(+)|eukprot:CAMPEP_0117005780 /NCGR_PEP_ID=MMETSP0472-20121206/6251_1 /TAXON_ID=693140 ORGANISM="Tiarina fusus, Strain LIS" /NCGR_SAMPLE_ID=MMETSP0472 /ASSEMBLY_ACC=CAM_ASM_000603 /LENGTH=659 /DNA_ID=CAMNT_0004707073 /DNA_START=160 /DNA_END=2139 /DNA_ORIENTATION=-